MPVSIIRTAPLEFPFDRAEKRCEFFNYSVKIGRHILVAQRRTTPRASQFWIHQGVTSEFLAKFWRTLWDRKQDMKINVFQWLVIHRALPSNILFAFSLANFLHTLQDSLWIHFILLLQLCNPFVSLDKLSICNWIPFVHTISYYP